MIELFHDYEVLSGLGQEEQEEWGRGWTDGRTTSFVSFQGIMDDSKCGSRLA